MFDNMLQLMRFSVYFKGILNTKIGYFHIKIIISAAHMLGGLWACSLEKFDFAISCLILLKAHLEHIKH